jgi:DNA mismatch endonuclease (patch repair protein)
MDTLTPDERSTRMRRVRSRDTKPELQLRRLVWALGYRYQKNRRDVVGQPDLTFVRHKCVIFLHGCFWHRHDCASGQRAPKSRTAFWTKKFERNVQRDAMVKDQLSAAGWRSLVIWECELENRSSVEERIRGFLDA